METTPDTLYYDGRCPLCRAEMDKLRVRKTDSLQLVDIHGFTPAPDDPDRQTLLRNLHMQRGDGSWLVGVEANVAAWQHSRWAWCWRWLTWPLVRPLADLAYGYWAELRYRRLYGDAATPCDLPPPAQRRRSDQ